MSDYFDSSLNRVEKNSLAKSEQVNNLRDETGTAFDLLPTPDAIAGGAVSYVADAGVANAYSVTLSSGTLAEYSAGMSVVMKPANNNTGASTIDVNSIGTKAIKRTDGTDVAAGDIKTTGIYNLVYNGTNFVITTFPTSYTTDAAASASAAATSETNAATSETNAAASESAAASSASAASTSASNASTSETNAASSASSASTSATNASNSASAASTSASNASTSASEAATSASNAADSETNAATSESNAATSESNAATSEANAAASYDSFDDRYLGAKAADPTLDNDGDPLITGAIYWNTTDDEWKVYTGSAWTTALTPDSSYATLTGTETLTNKTITAPVIDGGYSEEVYSLTGSDVDPGNGSIQYKATTGSETITATNLANGQAVVLRLSAATDVAFTGFTWITSDGAAPTILSSNDVFVLWMENSTKFVAYVGGSV